MPQRDDNSGSGATRARIEAQDVSFVLPLREYLEQYGCDVSVNRQSGGSFLYVIGAGESPFVKSFFERYDQRSQKKLAVLYEARESDLEWFASHHVKVYLVDAVPLTDIETKHILAFLFTGTGNRIDSRKGHKRTLSHSVIVREPTREQEKSIVIELKADERRIAETMSQVFGTKHPLPKSSKRFPVRTYFSRLILAIVFVLLAPMLTYIISLGLGTGLMALSGKSLVNGDIAWTGTLLQASVPYVNGAQTILQTTGPFLDIVGMGGIAEDQDRFVSILIDARQAEDGVLTIFSTSKSVATAIFFPQPTSSATTASDVLSLTTNVTRVSEHLALVQAELDSLLGSDRFPFRLPVVQNIGHRGLTALTNVRALIDYTEKLLTLYPEMAGFRKPQTYLILLQNSMELRPTGGFIGSLLLMTFTDGSVSDMHVLDVYSADGQLKGHVDPPLPIREIMGQEHWYLRDSNWNPDFSISGKEAAFFYEKEMGQSVDGVIGVSLPVVTNLLHVLGPVDVPDFNERISESNFFAKSLLYTQTDFFPGSTQKKDFLGALTNAILLRMTSDRSVSAGELLRSMTNSIQARDVQFYFSDPSLEQLVSQWGWSGGMNIAPCAPVIKASACVGDGVGIVEANLGINKANYFVTHEALSDITFDTGGNEHQILTVKLANTTPSSVPNGSGAYVVYLRLYYPKGTTISSVRLDGKSVLLRDPGALVPPPVPYLVVDASGSATVAGVPFSVAPQSQRQLVVETTRSNSLPSGIFSYQFSLRKQAGVSAYPWHVVFHYPVTWNIEPESGLAKDGSLRYNTTLDHDAHFRALISNTQ